MPNMSKTQNIEQFNYPNLLAQVKERVKLAQQRAIYAANDDKAKTQPTVAQLPEYNFTLVAKIRSKPNTHCVILTNQ